MINSLKLRKRKLKQIKKYSEEYQKLKDDLVEIEKQYFIA